MRPAAPALVLVAASVAAAPVQAVDSLQELAERFLRAEGYVEQDVDALNEALFDALISDSGSVFLPGGDIGPLSLPVVVLEAKEGVLPRVRYRLRYGLEQIDVTGGGRMLDVSFVQLDRFNLGPAIREELAAGPIGDRVAPPEVFGVGPHVSYRLVMRPVQSRTADIVAAARTEISDEDAAAMDCHGVSCTAIRPVGEEAADWEAMSDIAMTLEPDYELLRDGLPTPAAALDLIALELGVATQSDGRFLWHGFEPRESVGPTEAFAEAVIEVNLGQEQALDAVLCDGEVMDHTIAAVWQRVVAVATGPGAPPMLLAARAYEPRSAP